MSVNHTGNAGTMLDPAANIRCWNVDDCAQFVGNPNKYGALFRDTKAPSIRRVLQDQNGKGILLTTSASPARTSSPSDIETAASFLHRPETLHAPAPAPPRPSAAMPSSQISLRTAGRRRRPPRGKCCSPPYGTA